MAKGKEIKRSKEETRAICLNYINEFTQENTDPSIKAEIIEEFQKETFWQRMGLKKVDKEGPCHVRRPARSATNFHELPGRHKMLQYAPTHTNYWRACKGGARLSRMGCAGQHAREPGCNRSEATRGSHPLRGSRRH